MFIRTILASYLIIGGFVHATSVSPTSTVEFTALTQPTSNVSALSGSTNLTSDPSQWPWDSLVSSVIEKYAHKPCRTVGKYQFRNVWIGDFCEARLYPDQRPQGHPDTFSRIDFKARFPAAGPDRPGYVQIYFIAHADASYTVAAVEESKKLLARSIPYPLALTQREAAGLVSDLTDGYEFKAISLASFTNDPSLPGPESMNNIYWRYTYKGVGQFNFTHPEVFFNRTVVPGHIDPREPGNLTTIA